jgi:hypothetical protein
MMGSNSGERSGMGRILVSAHTYQPEGVSEAFTACSTNTEIVYFSPANYLEYSARSLLII